MARPIAYDRELVLKQAMGVFWRQGYRATSVQDLVRATRLHPGSLYAGFGNKRGLYLAAVDTYVAASRAFIRAELRAPRPPLARIRRFFERIVQQTLVDPDAKGCMLVNALMEGTARDPALRRRVTGLFGELEAEFRAVLEQAAAAGDLGPGPDPAARARLLLVGLHGLRVYGRTRPPAAALGSVVDGLLACLAPA